MKILLFGASGTLGKELQKLQPDMICPTKSEVDIRNEKEVRYFIKSHSPDIVINAAAILENSNKTINVNVIGAANVALACIEDNIRLVFVSTDYVYKGDKGNYSEEDELFPFNIYAWSKLAGECSARGVQNHLIIRTSFGPSKFPYSYAFDDKFASKDYVDIIAPLILEASLSELTGVLNLGTEKKTLFEYAKQRNPDVLPIKITDSSFSSPKNTSLDLQKWNNYKSVKPHTNCRVCDSPSLTKYLDLGSLPLVNNLANTQEEALSKERFPLQIMFCEECGLSQLSVVVSPKKLFSYYTYRSGVNGGYIKHCKQMCDSLKLKGYLDSSSFVIDIAGNDGTLLKQFKENVGCRVLNVDPAENLVEVAISEGIDSIADFWSLEKAHEIVSIYGAADVITATNVFAHVDNITDFLKAVKFTLKEKGVLVLEFPYLIDFIEKMEFDTTYHEHLSYMSISPLNKLCNSLGLCIIDVEKQNIHGGTVRVTITHYSPLLSVNSRVFDFLTDEEDNQYNTIEKYKNWEFSVNELIGEFSKNVLQLKKEGYKISGFAASAKGNTFLNSAKIDFSVVDYIVDETKEKIGKVSPGTGIPIVNKKMIVKNPSDYMIILSWNFSEEIMKRARNFGFSGKFIVAIPSFQIID